MLKRQCGERRWGEVEGARTGDVGKEGGREEDGWKSDVAGVDVL